MKFLICANMPDTSRSDGFVSVVLNRGELSKLLRHRAMAVALQLQDRDFESIEFMDDYAKWYPATDGYTVEGASEAPRGFVPPKDEFKTCLQRCHVTLEGVYWTAHLEALDARVSTETLPWSFLEKP